MVLNTNSNNITVSVSIEGGSTGAVGSRYSERGLTITSLSSSSTIPATPEFPNVQRTLKTSPPTCTSRWLFSSISTYFGDTLGIVCKHKRYKIPSGVARMTEVPRHCMCMHSCTLPKCLHRGSEAASLRNPCKARDNFKALFVAIMKGSRSKISRDTLHPHAKYLTPACKILIFYTRMQNILHPHAKYFTPACKIFYTRMQNILHPHAKYPRILYPHLYIFKFRHAKYPRI